MKLTRTVMIFAAVLLLSGGLVAYAATTLFTQTFPSQTFTTPTLVAGSGCTSGNLVLDSSASTIPVYAGSPALIVYACSTSGATAFNIVGPSVTVTPTFTVPTGWTLGIDTAADACKTTTGLTSGSPITLSQSVFSGAGWYCLTTSSASNFTSFSITWSQ